MNDHVFYVNGIKFRICVENSELFLYQYVQDFDGTYYGSLEPDASNKHIAWDVYRIVSEWVSDLFRKGVISYLSILPNDPERHALYIKLARKVAGSVPDLVYFTDGNGVYISRQ